MKFIDLFAGIGGMRLGFEAAGGECVFSSEIDKYARQTYEANFGDEPAGDIRGIDAADIPDHDVLCAGFPCQPFSIAGVSKNNSLGRPTGFDDETRGTLFFEIARILREKKPGAFLLENVKNLKSHDNGRTFAVIRRELAAAGYAIHHRVIDASAFVPQHRERIYIVGIRSEGFGSAPFEFPWMPDNGGILGDFLEDDVDPKYTLGDKTWESLKKHKAEQRAKGNGFGYTIANPWGISRTMQARYRYDGSEILIRQGGGIPRKLTPRECARLMGFPDSFKIVCSDSQAYKQFGNSVVPPLIECIARRMA